ncbi:MAG TPA: acyltransferase, partial [Streptosporangiaceae bacterium]|nr:acyltransferase [Streptosporangiaceae bacterium]
MPKPIRAGQRYVPGLDGLRALAVLAVIAYHLGLGWAQGGMLGVGVFFTLSGYLITDLLLGQWDATGKLRLGDFWLRRARRLLPALFVMLAVVTAWITLLDRPSLPALRGAVAAAAVYVSNWWLIAQHSSYFARFGPPSPLGHLWSLAVEEQFYLAWPWLLLLGVRWTRRRRGHHGDRAWLAALTMLLAAASAAAMALLYHPGYDPTRVYEGTDTRAFGLLIGAALAFVWPSSRLRGDVSAGGRWFLEGTGIAGLTVIGLLIWRTSQYSPFIYPDGMILLSVATAAVVAAVASPVTRVGRVLGWRPLRWVGVRSYGIYLWHFPIIVLTTPAESHGSIARGAAQVAASIGVAALSWRFVEEPVRHGAIGRWWRQLTSGGLRVTGSRAWAAMGGATAVTVVAGMGLAGAVQPAPADSTTSSSAGSPSGARALSGAPASRPAASPHASGGERGTGSGAVPGGERGTGSGAVPSGPPLRSSCRAVVHIGDSTSEGMISPDYLPDPAQRLAAQYARVGVTTFHAEISGARSIYPETYRGQPNGYTVARQLVRDGYHGCWVLA